MIIDDLFEAVNKRYGASPCSDEREIDSLFHQLAKNALRDGYKSFNAENGILTDLDTSSHCVIIPEGIKQIGYKAIRIKDKDIVVFPRSLISADEDIFCAQDGNSYPEISMIFINDYTEVSSRTFAPRTYDRLYLPNNLRRIHERTFSRCIIRHLYLSENIERIGSEAFAFTRFGEFIAPDRNLSVGRNAFYYAVSDASRPQGGDFECFILNGTLYSYITESEVIRIPDGVEKIYSDILYSSSTKPIHITIPPSVRHIDNEAFVNCINLERLDIEGSNTSIGNSAFFLGDYFKELNINSRSTIKSFAPYDLGNSHFMRDLKCYNTLYLPEELKFAGILWWLKNYQALEQSPKKYSITSTMEYEAVNGRSFFERRLIERAEADQKFRPFEDAIDPLVRLGILGLSGFEAYLPVSVRHDSDCVRIAGEYRLEGRDKYADILLAYHKLALIKNSLIQELENQYTQDNASHIDELIAEYVSQAEKTYGKYYTELRVEGNKLVEISSVSDVLIIPEGVEELGSKSVEIRGKKLVIFPKSCELISGKCIDDPIGEIFSVRPSLAFLNPIAVLENNGIYNNKYRKIYLPKGITVIPDGLFRNCKIECVYIPYGIRRIGEYSFYDCVFDDIKNYAPHFETSALTFKRSVCKSHGIEGDLNEYLILNDTLYHVFLNTDSLVVPEGIRVIGKYCCTKNSTGFSIDGITIVIPEGVREIKSYAFSENINIKTLIIRSDDIKIGSEAFTVQKTLREIRSVNPIPYNAWNIAFLDIEGIPDEVVFAAIAVTAADENRIKYAPFIDELHTVFSERYIEVLAYYSASRENLLSETYVLDIVLPLLREDFFSTDSFIESLQYWAKDVLSSEDVIDFLVENEQVELIAILMDYINRYREE